MVKEFFPSGEICATVQLNIDPENDNHRAGAALMLDEIFSLVHKWQVILKQSLDVRIQHTGPERYVKYSPPRGRPPKQGIRERPEQLKVDKVEFERRDGRNPAVTLDLCEKYDWDMDKVCETLKIGRPALYSRLQSYERDGYIKRQKGAHTDWRHAERRDKK